MKIMWKVILLTAAFILVTAMCVSAASSLCAADKTTVSPGETLKITVTLKCNEKVKSMGITPIYDKNVFELVSGEWLVSGTLIKNYDKPNNRGAALFSSEKDCNGEVFELTLRVKNGVNGTKSEVKAELVLKDGESRDLPCSTVGTTVTVAKANETAAETTSAVTDKPNETQPLDSPETDEGVTVEESGQQTDVPAITQYEESEAFGGTEATPENSETGTSTKDFIVEGIPMDPPADDGNGIINKKTLLIAGSAILVCLILGWGLASSKK